MERPVSLSMGAVILHGQQFDCHIRVSSGFDFFVAFLVFAFSRIKLASFEILDTYLFDIKIKKAIVSTGINTVQSAY